MTGRLSIIAILKMLFSILAIVFFGQFHGAVGAQDTWSGYGGNIYNNRWASLNTDIDSSSILSLAGHCKATYPSGISATPIISRSIAYYPTWNGSFVAYDYDACQTIWQANVTAIINSYAPLTAEQQEIMLPVGRSSAQIDGDIIYFGTIANSLIVALDLNTGKHLGSIQIGVHPLATVTGSITFYDGKIYAGTSSLEEEIDIEPDYKCCSFVGNFAAVAFDSLSREFKFVWNVPMIPEKYVEEGWAGVGVWGGQPSIDIDRNQVYIGTGNVYTMPESVIACFNATRLNATATNDPCLPSDILQESLLALDLDTGKIKWIHHMHALDAWTEACGYYPLFPGNPTLCPFTPGPDADFGMAPTYVPGSQYTPDRKDIIVVGQKNGNLYALCAEDGTTLWATVATIGGIAGGLSWGMAVDESQIYYTALNSEGLPWQLQPQNTTIDYSAWGAVSLLTGDFVWGTPVPGSGSTYTPATVVGDLVLVSSGGSTTVNGSLVALKKTTGAIVAEFDAGLDFRGGIAVVGQSVIFGVGYGGIIAGPSVGDLFVMRLS
jgi:hypothetical protein